MVDARDWFHRMPYCPEKLAVFLCFLFLACNANALDAEKLDAYLGEQVRSTKIPGLVAIVVDKNSVIYHAAFGMQDVGKKIPMSTNTLFRIASMTKPIAATAFMKLVEDGKVRLDDPVEQFLPRFGDLPVIDASSMAAGEPSFRAASTKLTFRHLLSHSAGLAYGFSNNTVFKLSGGEAVAGNDEQYLLYDPGTSWSYGTGIASASRVLEQITGESLDTYLAKNLFEPLGMRDTGYKVDVGLRSRLATNHEMTDAGLVEVPIPDEVPVIISGDYGLWSTAADYAKFIQLFLNSGVAPDGTRILADETIELIGDNQLGKNLVTLQDSPLPMMARPFPLGAGRDGFGLGFQLTGNHRDAGSRAPGSMSWAGLLNTEFWIDRENGIGAVLLMQYLPFYDEDAIETLQGFERLIYSSGQLP